MRPLPVVPRALAGRDVEEAIDHYVNEGSPGAAFGFIRRADHVDVWRVLHAVRDIPHRYGTANLPEGRVAWGDRKMPI